MIGSSRQRWSDGYFPLQNNEILSKAPTIDKPTMRQS